MLHCSSNFQNEKAVLSSALDISVTGRHVHDLGYTTICLRFAVQQLLALCRLGAIARKHGSYASCVRMTNTLYGFNAMEVQEAFVKIREQVSMEQLSHHLQLCEAGAHHHCLGNTAYCGHHQ